MAELGMQELLGSPSEIAAVQLLLEQSPEYHFRVYGRPADSNAATRLFYYLPPGRSHADKFTFGLTLEGQMIGVIDLIRGHPYPDTVFITLFLLAERWQHRGLGTTAFNLLLKRLQTWHDIRNIRLELPLTNKRVSKFLSRVGFKPTGELVPCLHSYINTASEVWVRPLVSDPNHPLKLPMPP